jgi:hypothetical protein
MCFGSSHFRCDQRELRPDRARHQPRISSSAPRASTRYNQSQSGLTCRPTRRGKAALADIVRLNKIKERLDKTVRVSFPQWKVTGI